MTLEQMMKELETVKRGECRDCGNPWWFDHPNSWVCTTCAKTHGKSNSEEDGWSERNAAYQRKNKETPA